MLCAAIVAAEFVGGKATRDALFLTSLDATALPTMFIVTGLFSILLVAGYGRVGRRLRPAILVPGFFLASAVLFVLEWYLRPIAPTATAVVVYLHVSGAGPLLASGFWLVASERLDPHTAKARLGQIAGAGTLGGLLGALLAERVAARLGAPSMLIFLGALQFGAALLVWTLAAGGDRGRSAAAPRVEPTAGLARGLTAIAAAPHLRHLVALVLLGTTSAAMLEFLFKMRAVETFGSGDGLLRFFAVYYAATSLISFVLQATGSGGVLQRFGPALTTGSPSIALLAGCVGSLIAPGFGSLVVARAGESIFRASWFRAGYELFFNPVPADEKRVARPLIDVAVDRLGDALGGGLVRLAVVFLPIAQSVSILSVAMACAVGAVLAASHLNRWYLRSLETSLLDQGGKIDWLDTVDGALSRLRVGRRRSLTAATTTMAGSPNATRPELQITDSEVRDIIVLRGEGHEGVLEVLSRSDGLAAALVPHVIPLLALDGLADHADFALRKVAEDRIGELTDALLDPNQPDVIRRRLARVFAVCVSQRAVDGLVGALEDPAFGVRFQAARSLVAILEKSPRARVDRQHIETVVLREVTVSWPIWEGRRLLGGLVSESPLDAFVKDRAGQSLAHVFTLLSLVLPRAPLQIAFRSLHSADERLRGTALEYLEGVLPRPIRQRLWPFLEPRPAVRAMSRAAIVADLLRLNASVTLASLARKHG